MTCSWCREPARVGVYVSFPQVSDELYDLCPACLLHLVSDDVLVAGIRYLRTWPVDPDDPWLPPGRTYDEVYGEPPWGTFAGHRVPLPLDAW